MPQPLATRVGANDLQFVEPMQIKRVEVSLNVVVVVVVVVTITMVIKRVALVKALVLTPKQADTDKGFEDQPISAQR